jgi:opacity protein-like surface antigen
MRKVMFVLGVLLAVSSVAAAQDSSKFELFAGYSYTHVTNSDSSTANSNGGQGDFGFFPWKWAGVVANIGGSTSNGFNQANGTFISAPTTTYHYLFGPRIRYGFGRIEPFGQFLVGGVSRSAVVAGGEETLFNQQTVFGLSVGGGVDVKIVPHVSIRVAQLSYIWASYAPVSGPNITQNDFNLATGIVIH